MTKNSSDVLNVFADAFSVDAIVWGWSFAVSRNPT